MTGGNTDHCTTADMMQMHLEDSVGKYIKFLSCQGGSVSGASHDSCDTSARALHKQWRFLYATLSPQVSHWASDDVFLETLFLQQLLHLKHLFWQQPPYSGNVFAQRGPRRYQNRAAITRIGASSETRCRRSTGTSQGRKSSRTCRAWLCR